jgi:hypothetical protein
VLKRDICATGHILAYLVGIISRAFRSALRFAIATLGAEIFALSWTLTWSQPCQERVRESALITLPEARLIYKLIDYSLPREY